MNITIPKHIYDKFMMRIEELESKDPSDLNEEERQTLSFLNAVFSKTTEETVLEPFRLMQNAFYPNVAEKLQNWLKNNS